MEKRNKRDQKTQAGITPELILFPLVLLAGSWLGNFFVLKYPGEFTAIQPVSIFTSGIFADPEAGALTAFSAFLFDSLFYFLIVFLFGMTFMGVAVVPLTVFSKGFTLGTSLSALLSLKGTAVYFQSWITYLPTASFCTLVLLVFAGRAYGVSLKACRSLLNREAAPLSLKGYFAQFLCALLLLTAASALNTVLGLFAAILF